MGCGAITRGDSALAGPAPVTSLVQEKEDDADDVLNAYRLTGRQENPEDCIVDLRVYWDIEHRLDFIGGVVDFVHETKKERATVYYGFAISGTQAICKEGYTSAQGFVDHLRNVDGPIQAITMKRERTKLGTADLTRKSVVVCPAATISKIVASGPREDVEHLRSQLSAKASGKSIDLQLFTKMPGAAFFSKPDFGNLKEPFVLDTASTIVTCWSAEGHDPCYVTSLVEQCITAKDGKAWLSGIRRCNFSVDHSSNRLMYIIVGTVTSAVFECWRCFQVLFADGFNAGSLESVEVHCPEYNLATVRDLIHGPALKVSLNSSFWTTQHGAFFVPEKFLDRCHDTSTENWDSATRSLSKSLSHIKTQASTDGFKVAVEDRGITCQQLFEVETHAKNKFGADYPAATMYDVVNMIVKPVCAQQKVPYAVYANNGKPRRASIFVSHAWHENFAEFVKSVIASDGTLTYSERQASFCCHKKRFPTFWICAFAIFQTDDRSLISDQVGQDPTRSPFTKALAHADKFMVVRNEQVNNYSRIWCCWELHMAFSMGFLTSNKLVLAGPSPPGGEVLHDVANAEASQESDKEQILKHIEREPGVREHINSIIELVAQ